MRLRSLTAARYDVSLNIAFKHASAMLASTENIIVVAESEQGQFGYGEGCPRSYVTGETVASAATFVEHHYGTVIESVRSVEDLKLWIAHNQVEIDANPAAFCAVELALLDLLGKENDCTVEALLDMPQLDGDFRYSAVLGDSEPGVFNAQLHRYWKAGFRDFKLKLSGKAEHDQEKISYFRRYDDSKARLRVDANNLWCETSDCIDFLNGLHYPFFAVEEPLQAKRLGAFLEIASDLNTKVIVDESFLRAEQLTELADNPERWILNCRVSKLGGLLRSLAVVEEALAHELQIIVGAHVGETSLLTRAALALAQCAGEALVAQEGAFGTHLLKRDLCQPVVMFREGGILSTSHNLAFERAGWGLEVDSGCLTPITRPHAPGRRTACARE